MDKNLDSYKLEKTKGFYRFGEFKVEARERRLWHSEDLVPLTPKEFEVLFYLVERAGKVAEKNDLLDAVWADTFVEEATLARNISWLRKKLAEFSGEEIFIETVPKLGYRFVAEVEHFGEDENLIIVEEQTIKQIEIEETISQQDGVSLKKEKQVGLSENVSEVPTRPNYFSAKLIWLTLGFIFVTGLFFFAYQIYFRDQKTKAVIVSEVRPFSGLRGREDGPAFSPDGKTLAYSWNGGEETDQRNIYVRLLEKGDPLKLTDSKLNNRYPTFSPEGSEIAFLREAENYGDLIIVPSLGGTERKIRRLFSGNYSISYAPDGKNIAVIDTENSKVGGQYAIYLIDTKTFERKRLTAPAEFVGETTPRFSPDGKSIAFVRIDNNRGQDLFVVPAGGGEPKRITFDNVVIHSLTWSPDSDSIYFVSFRESKMPQLWRISAEGGEPELVPVNGKNISNVAMSPDGKTLAFVDNFNYRTIWRVPPDGQPAERFISSNGVDFYPVFSPDGSRLVFASDRRGKFDLWIADSGGKNLRRLTDSFSELSGPRFSSDDSQLVFREIFWKKQGIYTISTEGGSPKLIWQDESRFNLPFWAENDKWIYFTSERSGGYEIWKIKADGTDKKPVQVTKSGGFYGQISPDGKTLFFTKTQTSGGIWRMSLENGKEQKIQKISDAGFRQVFNDEINEYGNTWIVRNKGIYFLVREEDQTYRIKFYDLAADEIKTTPEGIYQIPPNIDTMRGLTFDGKDFLVTVREPTLSNIMLADLPQ